MGSRADVLVVTALKLERLAVREHLSRISVESGSGVAADIGMFSTDPGHEVVVAVLQTGAGNVGAAVHTARAEEFFRPSIVVMTGIAGGLKDVAIGDVVASEKVYWTEAGKEADGWFPRIDVAPVSDSLRQIARGIATDESWRARLPGELVPASFVAPIAVGEKVLASSHSEIVKQIRRHCSDAVCIDMEDYGTLRAGAATERTRAFAVRGISDLLDGKGEVEKVGSQEQAAAHAAAFTFELVAEAVGRSNAPSRTELVDLLARLYPEGPQQRAIWERAGGDVAGLDLRGSGRERWWHALGLVASGGGPLLGSLLAQAKADFPGNSDVDATLRSA